MAKDKFDTFMSQYSSGNSLGTVVESEKRGTSEKEHRSNGPASQTAITADQRRALAGHPDLVRLVIEHDDEREGAADALRQLYDRRLRVSVVDIAEVLHGGFRIRLRVELYPVRLKVGAYLARVLDNAVMHQHHAVIA